MKHIANDTIPITGNISFGVNAIELTLETVISKGPKNINVKHRTKDTKKANNSLLENFHLSSQSSRILFFILATATLSSIKSNSSIIIIFSANFCLISFLSFFFRNNFATVTNNTLYLIYQHFLVYLLALDVPSVRYTKLLYLAYYPIYFP